MLTSSHGRPTTPPRLRLRSLVITKAAHSATTRHALIAQVNDDQNKESITSAVTQWVKEHIDAQLVAKGLEDVISLSADVTSLDLLLRLAYIIDNSGEWASMVPIVRVAKHQGRVEQLPIKLSSADVEGVCSRAVFDSRCEAMRQLSLIQRHIGVTLERRSNGVERLDGRRLTIHTLQTLPADHPFRNGYDEANPVCQIDDGEGGRESYGQWITWSCVCLCAGDDYASVRDAVLDE